jgi:thiosulfate/3-mercaptopyruvate sulfurtransferase
MSLRQRQKWWRVFPLALTAALGLALGPGGPAAHAVPQGGYAHGEVLIQPEELKTLIDQKEPALKIIDVRHEVKYYLGHIPGAVQVWRHELEKQR